MNIEIILSLVTIIVTLILGLLAKKATWISDHIIPIQNLIIGIVVAVIYYFMTKDVSVTIAMSGIIAGGTYDIVKNLKALTDNTKDSEEVVAKDGSVG